MAQPRVLPGLLSPAGFQSSSLANSTAIAVNSTVRAAKPSLLIVSVETNNVRYRRDGTAPTLSTGILLTVANSPYVIPYDRTSNLKFQRQTGTAKVQLEGLKGYGNNPF